MFLPQYIGASKILDWFWSSVPYELKSKRSVQTDTILTAVFHRYCSLHHSFLSLAHDWPSLPVLSCKKWTHSRNASRDYQFFNAGVVPCTKDGRKWRPTMENTLGHKWKPVLYNTASTFIWKMRQAIHITTTCFFLIEIIFMQYFFL